MFRFGSLSISDDGHRKGSYLFELYYDCNQFNWQFPIYYYILRADNNILQLRNPITILNEEREYAKTTILERRGVYVKEDHTEETAAVN